MIYLLDTNVISDARRPERSARLAAWLFAQDDASLYLSVVSIGEIARGIVRQDAVNPAFAAELRAWLARTEAMFADRILAFTAEDARIWGAMSARIGHPGADLMIAAQAEARQATVVTRNVADFEPTGVNILNPYSI